MKKIIAAGFLLSVCCYFLIQHFLEQPANNNQITKIKQKPSDWIYRQRAYPDGKLDYAAYREAGLQAAGMRNNQHKSTGVWELTGPINIGGRISDVELHPGDTSIIYVGTASGGIFKVTDYGQTVTPIFDNAFSLSIGDLAIDPQNPNIIYAGTGESSASSNTGAFPGTGIYKTTDGGNTWNYTGLDETHYIGRIVVDPQNSNKVYVAAMGHMYGKNIERGVYKSTDGGSNWQNIFYLNDSTGCIDFALNPQNPDKMYAAMWTRVRYPWGRQYTGPTAGIYRSIDGGNSWSQLTNGLPPSDNNTGKIAISVSESNPDIIYAAWSSGPGNTFDNVYKSLDGGDSWSQINVTDMSSYYNSFGWYFGNIRVDPNDPDVVYVVGFDCYKSTDGGVNWLDITSGITHVDQHGLYIHPLNSDFLVLGNDGGLYLSADGGNNWTKSLQLPITQFYACEVDYQFPNRYYGGTQDNGTNRTLTGNLNDWQGILGGDGFYVLVDPTDNNYVYAEWQNGGFCSSIDGGNNFSWSVNGINPLDRFNWNTPFVLDPTDPTTLYIGTQRIYKTTDRAANWTAISNDLTNGPYPGYPNYGTITTIAVAPSNPLVIFAGTEDGNVWSTTDGGNNWNLLSAALPNLWVTRVAVHPTDAQTAYVTFSGYKMEDYIPHVFKTTDGGSNWTDISSNLPGFPVNDIIIDPDSLGNLYIATDFGVYVSFDDGGIWEVMGSDLPAVPVFDLVLHNPSRTLVAGTYGRSMYKFDLATLYTTIGINEQLTINNAQLTIFPNPLSYSALISFELDEATEGALEIYDLQGKLVETLQKGFFQKGENSFSWKADAVAAGTYLCRLRTKEEMRSKRVMVVK